jgi:hypothetical protein
VYLAVENGFELGPDARDDVGDFLMLDPGTGDFGVDRAVERHGGCPGRSGVAYRPT